MWYNPDDDETDAYVRLMEGKEVWGEEPEVFVSGAPPMVTVYKHKYLEYVAQQNKIEDDARATAICGIIALGLLPVAPHVYYMIALAGIATHVRHPTWSVQSIYKYMTSRVPLIERRGWVRRACSPEENMDAVIIDKVLSSHIDDIWDGGQMCSHTLLTNPDTTDKKVMVDLSLHRLRAYGGFTKIIYRLAQHYKDEVGSVPCVFLHF